MSKQEMVYTLFMDFLLDDESMFRYRISHVDPEAGKDKIKGVMDKIIENQEIFELEGRTIIKCLGAKIEGKTSKNV